KRPRAWRLVTQRPPRRTASNLTPRTPRSFQRTTVDRWVGRPFFPGGMCLGTSLRNGMVSSSKFVVIGVSARPENTSSAARLFISAPLCLGLLRIAAPDREATRGRRPASTAYRVLSRHSWRELDPVTAPPAVVAADDRPESRWQLGDGLVRPPL